MIDLYSKNKLHIYQDEEGFVLMESIYDFEQNMFVGKILDSDIEEFIDIQGEHTIFNKSMTDLVVSPKQILCLYY